MNVHMMRKATFPILAAMVLAPAVAVSQVPGSTGGSVGKQDKSVSGGTGTSQAQPTARSGKNNAPAQTAGSCRNVVGTWKWYLGLSETVYFSDGSIRHS